MPDFGEPLSDRELEVLRCLAQGSTNKEIAAELVISQNTVKVHLRNVYTKLGVSSRTEATTVALQQGMLTIPGVAVTFDTPPGTEPETAVSTSATQTISPKSINQPINQPTTTPTGWLSWRTGTLLLALLMLPLVAVVAYQTLNNGLTSTPEPTLFEETAVSDDGKWARSRPMPEPRAGMAVVAIGLDIYQFGGETADGVDNAAYLFDTALREWRAIEPKPTAVTAASGAVLFGEIYLAGGRLPSGEASNVVEAYSPANERWRAIAPLPEPIEGGLLLTDGGFLYLFGGKNEEVFLATVYRYDPASDGWSELPEQMAVARTAAAGGYLTGKFYVVGGKNEAGVLTSCEIFDVDAGWSRCGELSQGRTGAKAAVLLNQLYVLGGEGDQVSYSELYNPNSNGWQIVDTPALETGSWADLGVTTVETRIYAFGGRLGASLSDETYLFRPIFQTFLPSAPSNADP